MRTLKANKFKLVTVVGTRPEIIRLSRIIPVLDDHFEHLVVNTYQNYDYELNNIFFEKMSIRNPDISVQCAGASPTECVANVILESGKIFSQEKPDAVLILGDTNSSLAAISAKKNNIPIFHMEAGNRCFDDRVPEEVNRRIVDHISDVNMTYTGNAKDYLVREGRNPYTTIITGSPLFEVFNYYYENITQSNILKELQLEPGKYFVVSCHREENLEGRNGAGDLLKMLCALAQYELPVIVSTHPRARKHISKQDAVLPKNVRLIKPLDFFSYNKLQKCSYCVLSDSGSITEESDILGFNAVNLRDAHERPEGMDYGVVPFVGLSIKAMVSALSMIKSDSHSMASLNPSVSYYSRPNVSAIVADTILSYINYIDKYNYRKNK